MSIIMTAGGRIFGTATFLSGNHQVTISNSSIVSTSTLFACRVNNAIAAQLYFAPPSSGSVVLTSTQNETSTCNYMVLN